MSENTTPPTPAGWYPDGQVPGQSRYWDGAQWTDQVQPAVPTEAAVTVEQPPTKKQPWYTRKGIVIPVAALVGLIVVVGVIGSINSPEEDEPAALTSSAPDAEEETVVEEEPEEEPTEEATEEPAAEQGSLATPFPVGYALSIYEGSPDNTLATMTVAVKDWNANAAIAQANQFNDPAQPGYHYVAVEYTVTGENQTEPAVMGTLLWDWSLSMADGTLIGESNSTVVMPDGWNSPYEVNDLYAGQTGSAVVIYQVPDPYAGALLATAYGQYVAL